MPSESPERHGLRAEGLDVGYGGPLVLRALTAGIPVGGITAIIGANASGKSTLLRALARLLRPAGGVVYLDGTDIAHQSTRSVATRLGLLPQSPRTPEGISVEDLVRRGRYPHQRLFDQWSRADESAVRRALELTGMVELADHAIDRLSGGQRQRAWLAMALAQDARIMLLDEPTTHLDIAHQMETLELLADLNESEGRTVVMVLHDLNQACRYASHLVAMTGGRITTAGRPSEVVTPDLIRRVFGLDATVIADPVTGTPLCIPQGRRRAGPPRS